MLAMKATQKINAFLEARRAAEFESAAAAPADRVHSRELLEAAGLEPTRHNLMWLRRYMLALGWKPGGNFRVGGKQGQGYCRAISGQPVTLQIGSDGTVTPEQLAVMFGLPLSEVEQAVTEGAPTRGSKIVPAQFMTWYVAQRQDTMREGQGLAAAATRSLEGLVRLRELKIQDMEDRLIPTGEVAAFLGDAFNVIRLRFAAVESQVPDLSDEQRQQLRSALADSVAELRGDKVEDWIRVQTDDEDEMEFG